MSREKWAKADQDGTSRDLSILRSRHQTSGQSEQQDPAEGAAESSPPEHQAVETAEAPAKPKPKKARPGTTRSWYLSDDVAAELEQAAEQLYHELYGRHPKRVVLGALIRHGLKHQGEARKELQRKKKEP